MRFPPLHKIFTFVSITVSQGKVITQAHSGLVPAQFLLQQTQPVKSAETQSQSTSAGTLILTLSQISP